MRRVLVVFVLTVLMAPLSFAQAPKRIAIRAGRLIDAKSDQPIANALILIEGDKIVSVTPGGAPPAGVELIDSRAPRSSRLIDTTRTSSCGRHHRAGLRRPAPQAIHPTAPSGRANARLALLNGFTTMRDVETEGAMYADVDVKTAINRGSPGCACWFHARHGPPALPAARLFWELELPHGVQVVDGVSPRKAVREQVSYGADWIKYHSDGRYYHFPTGSCSG
jgi:imidazolonepropionase-like amidohydrolase